MATVKFDTIDGTTMEMDGIGVARAVRRCIVTDVEMASNDDPIALYRAIQQAVGMPQFGDGHPVDSKCRLQRHVIRGISNNGFVVDLIYEKLFSRKKPPVRGYFVITRSSSVTSYNRNDVPELGELIMFSESRKLLEVSYLAPQRQITMRGSIPYATNIVEVGDYRLAMSTQLEDMEDCVGSVNVFQWSGLAGGRWLCTSFGTSVETEGEAMSVEATFATQPGGWMIYGVEKDASGRAVRDAATLNAALDSLKRDGYFHGVRERNGVLAVGMYPTADFLAAFGFG